MALEARRRAENLKRWPEGATHECTVAVLFILNSGETVHATGGYGTDELLDGKRFRRRYFAAPPGHCIVDFIRGWDHRGNPTAAVGGIVVQPTHRGCCSGVGECSVQ
jgi:hypothetical protein